MRGGEFVALLGPSGAGKTTLFRCISGLLAPDRGTVHVGDDDVPGRPAVARDRRRIAVVFQQFNLVNRLTAFENVLAGRLGYVPAWRGMVAPLRVPRRRPDARARMPRSRRPARPHKARRSAPTRCPGGQQQRIAIARALAQSPRRDRRRRAGRDEPRSARRAPDVLELLQGHLQAHRTAWRWSCSLHQVHLARTYADRVVGLSHGRVVIDEPIGQFDRSQPSNGCKPRASPLDRIASDFE